MSQVIGLTERETVILNGLNKHLSDQLKHNYLRALPDKIDENTGEVLNSGSKAIRVNPKFGEHFNEAFQNSLKRAGKYVSVTDGNGNTWNVIAFNPETTRQSDFQAADGSYPMVKLDAQVILVREKYIGELDIPVEVQKENIEVNM